MFRSSRGEQFTVTADSQWVQGAVTVLASGRSMHQNLPFHPPLPLTEAEWTEWFDRDDERGSGDWEKLSDLHAAFPERLCSSPLDMQVLGTSLFY